jgi:hypothetical protein
MARRAYLLTLTQVRAERIGCAGYRRASDNSALSDLPARQIWGAVSFAGGSHRNRLDHTASASIGCSGIAADHTLIPGFCW